jgi:hypothetical protein
MIFKTQNTNTHTKSMLATKLYLKPGTKQLHNSKEIQKANIKHITLNRGKK